MEFVKYSSLENHYQERFINSIVREGKDTGEWVATEKVHGANYAVHINVGTGEIVASKRSGFIGEFEKFYNHKEVLADLKIRIEQNLDFDETLAGGVNEIVLRGELYGGGYDGFERFTSMVQKEVQYHPEQQFILFDVMVDGEYVGWDDVKSIGNNLHIDVVPELGRGTFDEMLKLPNEFQTKVPDIFGLHPVEGNITEGLVIRPIHDDYLNCGKRVMIKSKNAKFSEKDHTKSLPKPSVRLSESAAVFLGEVSKYLTKNRLNAVVSKLGNVKQNEFGKVQGMFVQDALKDYREDSQIDLKDILDREYTLFNKELTRVAATELRAEWLNILDQFKEEA